MSAAGHAAAADRAGRCLPVQAEDARGATKFPLIVELEPLFACNLKCEGCGKIQHPRRRAQAAHAGRAGGRRRCEESRRADGVDRRRRAADAPADRRDRAPAGRAGRSTSSCARTRCCCARSWTSSQPSPYFALAVHIDGLRERHDESVAQGGRLRRGGGGHQGGQAARLPGHHQHDLLQHRHPADRHRGAQLPQRRARGRRDDDLARRTPTRRPPTRSTSSASSRPGSCSRRPSRAARRKRWRLNHSPLFLDFLEGKVDFDVHARGASRPTRCSAGSGPAT